MELTLDVARKLHILTLELENDGTFHRAFCGVTSRGAQRVLIKQHATGKSHARLVTEPGRPAQEYETAPGYIWREAIRAYLCRSWSLKIGGDSTGPERDWEQCVRPTAPKGSDDEDNYFVVVAPREVQAARKTTDYSALPDGTILHTRSEGDFIKGPHPIAKHVSALPGRPVFAWNAQHANLTHPGWFAATPEGESSARWDIVGFTFAQDQIDAEIAALRADPEHPLYRPNEEPDVAFAPSYNFLENTMTKPAIIDITTKTLVNGTDVKDLSDSAIYDLIASQENAIADLEKIQNKPRKLVVEIDKRKAGIAALVEYLDSKE